LGFPNLLTGFKAIQALLKGSTLAFGQNTQKKSHLFIDNRATLA
jgi:hypothetical protein